MPHKEGTSCVVCNADPGTHALLAAHYTEFHSADILKTFDVRHWECSDTQSELVMYLIRKEVACIPKIGNTKTKLEHFQAICDQPGLYHTNMDRFSSYAARKIVVIPSNQ